MNQNKVINFPNDFMWGASTSVYAYEEDISSSHLDKKDQSRKVLGDYHKYQDDFEIAKDMGHNIHLVSVAWSKIEPYEGVFDIVQIQHYRKVIYELQKRGLKVIICLFDFITPDWFEEKGGWYNSRSVGFFTEYVRYTVGHLGQSVDFWLTMKSPSLFSYLGYLKGAIPPEKKSFLAAYKVLNNLLNAHKEAYFMMHSILKEIFVGMSHNYIFILPKGNSLRDKLAVKAVNYFANERILEKSLPYCDFVGMEYYTCVKAFFEFGGEILNLFGLDINDKKNVKGDLGWAVYPKGIYKGLMRLKSSNLPIIITGNGIADKEDSKRARFIYDHLIQVHRAFVNGAKIAGYIYKDLLDGEEIVVGKKARFGLVKVDYENQFKREVRESAKYYTNICITNKMRLD